MKDRFLIYTLIDPRDGEIRYVGKSSIGIKRAKAHAYPKALSKDKSWCGNWIRKLKRYGLKYRINILQKFESSEHLCPAEIYWIAYFRKIGCRLTNVTDGGEGATGRIMSEATRAKLRLVNLGNKNCLGKKRNYSPELRKEYAERARKRSADLVIRAKISAAKKGKKQSPETVANRATSLRARWALTPRKPLSDESKAKMSESAKHRSSIKVIQDADGNLYYGYKSVAEKFGLCASHICSILTGRRTNNLGLKEV